MQSASFVDFISGMWFFYENKEVKSYFLFRFSLFHLSLDTPRLKVTGLPAPLLYLAWCYLDDAWPAFVILGYSCLLRRLAQLIRVEVKPNMLSLSVSLKSFVISYRRSAKHSFICLHFSFPLLGKHLFKAYFVSCSKILRKVLSTTVQKPNRVHHYFVHGIMIFILRDSIVKGEYLTLKGNF